MLKIQLVNMPFADIRIPSIAITQLKSIAEQHFPGQVDVILHYFNLEMADYLGPEIYEFISNGGASNDTGFGDWFFRQAAFPGLPDNTAAYFERYGQHFGEEILYVYDEVIKYKREGLDEFLDELIMTHQLYEADIVGLTSMFMQNVPGFALARKLKEANPDVIILMGGANCESPMGEEIVKNVPCIDYTFSGMALKSFPAFIGHVLANEPEKTDAINGVFSRRNLGLVALNRSANQAGISPSGDELPIDEVVDLDYDAFLDLYEEKFTDRWKDPYLLFETSRGCWWGAKAHCTFCGLNGGNMFYRAVKPAKAIAFFNSLFERYASRVNHLSCVDNIVPREYLTDVFPKLTVPKNVTMFYEVKADLSEKDMQILADAQVLEIQPGIESLATSTLKLMKKGTTAFNNIKFLKYCITYGIAPAWNLLIGFPGEQEEVYKKYKEDLPLLYHLPPPNGIFPVRFDRYSPYFTKAAEYGLDLHPLDYYKLTYPFADETIANMAYYFADHNYDAEYIRITAQWLRKLEELVGEWVQRWQFGKNTIKPKLYLYHDRGQDAIYDSRSGKVVKYALGEVGKAILNHLSSHKNKVGLFQELSHIPADLLEEELASLQDKGFLFEERGSMLSLVFEAEPTAFRIEAYHSAVDYQDQPLV